jgi:thymidine kinase
MSTEKVQEEKSKCKAEDGRIELIYGPMFASKTTELMKRIREEQLLKKNCYVVRYSEDNRKNKKDDFCLSNHDGHQIPANPFENLQAVDDLIESLHSDHMPDCIGIDEIQFFKGDPLFYVQKWRSRGIRVICSGLDRKTSKKFWPVYLQVAEEADELLQLTSVCTTCCVRRAPFTWSDKNIDGNEVIGGAETYEAVCNYCYEQKKKNFIEQKSNKEVY